MADDFEKILNLRKEAAEWLSRSGIDQWTDIKRGATAIKDWLESGSTFVVQNEGMEIVASLALGSADPDFWTAEEITEPAVYLYKFMINRSNRGTGLGEILLDWACEKSSQRGAYFLRLDCWKTNSGLHRYYLDRGFDYLTTRSKTGRKSGALFERPTGVRTARDSPIVVTESSTLAIQFNFLGARHLGRS